MKIWFHLKHYLIENNSIYYSIKKRLKLENWPWRRTTYNRQRKLGFRRNKRLRSDGKPCRRAPRIRRRCPRSLGRTGGRCRAPARGSRRRRVGPRVARTAASRSRSRARTSRRGPVSACRTFCPAKFNTLFSCMHFSWTLFQLINFLKSLFGSLKIQK